MKNIISKSLLIAALSLSMVSCEEFLTENDPNTITVETFWQNPSDAMQGLAAAYGALQQAAVMGGNEAQANVRTDLARSNPWEETLITLQNFSYNETNYYSRQKWNQLYVGVFRANQVLEFVPGITMDEDEKAVIIAEAHFLRGLYFFWLTNTFNEGAVPMPIAYPKSSAEYNLPVSTKEELFLQIEKDFKYAAAEGALPEKWDEENLGRATWGAANGLLGQVYLYNEKWDLAAEQFKKIIDRPDLYSLVEEIGWNFDLKHEWNSESLFEVNFSDVVKEGFNGYNTDRTDGQGAEATVRGRMIASGQFGGYSTVIPSAFARDLFMNQDQMDPSNPINEKGRVYSKRCEASVYFYDCGYPYYVMDEDEEVDFNLFPSRIYIKKFQNWDGNETEDTINERSGINERVLRLADVYLMYAEALVMQNGDASADVAMEYINKVRSRAGVMLKHYTNKDDIMEHLMYVERPLELAYEGHGIRWNDMRRWGIIKEHYATLASKFWDFGTKEDPEDEPFREYELSSANFIDANYYLPIPNTETSNNPHIN